MALRRVRGEEGGGLACRRRTRDRVVAAAVRVIAASRVAAAARSGEPRRYEPTRPEFGTEPASPPSSRDGGGVPRRPLLLEYRSRWLSFEA